MEIKTTIYDVFGYLMAGVVGGISFVVAYGHSVGQGWSYAISVLKSLSTTEVALLLVLAYLLGHLISAISSLVIDKPVHRLSLFRNYQALEAITSRDAYQSLSARFEGIFGFPLGSSDFRLCVCYAEATAPVVYQTAFVFLAFYGMARHVTFVLMLYAAWEAVNWLLSGSCIFALYAGVALVGALAFFYHYLRFLKYFKQHIVGAFLVGSEVQGSTDRTARRSKKDTHGSD